MELGPGCSVTESWSPPKGRLIGHPGRQDGTQPTSLAWQHPQSGPDLLPRVVPSKRSWVVERVIATWRPPGPRLRRSRSPGHPAVQGGERLRSPWVVAAAVLAWLGVAGALGEGPGDVVILWALGLAFAVACLQSARRRPAVPLAPDPPDPLTPERTQASTALDDQPPALTASGQTQGQRPPASSDSTPLASATGELAGHESSGPDNAAPSPERTLDSAPQEGDVAAEQTADEGQGGTRPRMLAAVVGTDTSRAEVLTAADVATWLSVPVEDVVAAMDSGHMPGNQLGDQWRAAHDSVRRWLDGRWAADETPELSLNVEPPSQHPEAR